MRVRKIEYVIETIEISVSLMKKRSYENLNKTLFVDSKLLWKTVKPHLYNKVSDKDKIHLIENNELAKTDLETAGVLNTF